MGSSVQIHGSVGGSQRAAEAVRSSGLRFAFAPAAGVANIGNLSPGSSAVNDRLAHVFPGRTIGALLSVTYNNAFERTKLRGTRSALTPPAAQLGRYTCE